MTAVALNVSPMMLSACANVLQTAIQDSRRAVDRPEVFETGTPICLSTLDSARSPNANVTGAMQGPAPATPSALHFIPGGVLLAQGIMMFVSAQGVLHIETSKTDRKRAVLRACMSVSGSALIVIASAVTVPGLNNDQYR